MSASNQIIYNTKTYQKENIYEGNDDPKIYLTKYLNNLLRSLSSSSQDYCNKIIGCDGFFLDLVDDSIFRVLVSPGKLILDSTLIEFPTPTFLDIDLTPYSTYDEVVVTANYKYLHNMNKASFQLLLRNSSDSSIISNAPILKDQGLNTLVLSRFRIIRKNGNISEVRHPYGRWVNSFYSDFLKNISPLAVAGSNEIFRKLVTEVPLYESFTIRDEPAVITVPLFFNTTFEDNKTIFQEINKQYLNKMYRRYAIPDASLFYYSITDRNIKFRTEITDDQYSYAI